MSNQTLPGPRGVLTGSENLLAQFPITDRLSPPGAEKGHVIWATFNATVLKQVATEIRKIKTEFRGVVSEESIDLVAGEAIRDLADSRVPQFVPLFVGRFTRERLRKLTGVRRRAGS